MRYSLHVCVFSACAVLAMTGPLGCGDDGGSTAGSGGAGGSGASGDGSGGSGASGAGSGGSGASGDGSGDGGGAATITMTGTVVDGFSDGDPIGGATVTLIGSGVSATTNSVGEFSLEVPAAGPVLLHAVADGYVSTAGAIDPASETFPLEVEVLNTQFIDGLFGLVDTPRDPTKGVVAIDLGSDEVVGGEETTIGADFEVVAHLNPDDELVEGSAFEAGDDPIVIYMNVDAGTTTAAITAAGRTCTQVHAMAEWPVLPNTVTGIEFTCE